MNNRLAGYISAASLAALVLASPVASAEMSEGCQERIKRISPFLQSKKGEEISMKRFPTSDTGKDMIRCVLGYIRNRLGENYKVIAEEAPDGATYYIVPEKPQR